MRVSVPDGRSRAPSLIGDLSRSLRGPPPSITPGITLPLGTAISRGSGAIQMQNIRQTVIALSIVAGLCSAGSAPAAPIISGDYYEENGVATCATNLGGCIVTFSATPSKILLTSIACVFNVASQITEVDLGIRDTPGSAVRRETYLALGSPVTASSGTSRTYTVSMPVDFMTAQGRYPSVFADVEGGAGNASGKCKITGRIQQ